MRIKSTARAHGGIGSRHGYLLLGDYLQEVPMFHELGPKVGTSRTCFVSNLQ